MCAGQSLQIYTDHSRKKSRLMLCNVSEDVGCNIKVCHHVHGGVTNLQRARNSNTGVVILSIFEKNTLDFRSALVFVSPKCPA